MKSIGTGIAIAIIVVSAFGCQYIEGTHAPSMDRHGDRLCAWLPDEGDEWRLRRSAVNDKVRRFMLPALQRAELDAWLFVERSFQRDPMFDTLALTEPGDKAVLFIDDGSTQPRAFAFADDGGVLAQLHSSGLFEQIHPLTPEAMGDVLARFRPRRIGIDYSARVPLADGITTGSRQFAAWLVGREYAASFRSAEVAAILLRSTRTADETALARQAARCLGEIVDRAGAASRAASGQSAAQVAWGIVRDLRGAAVDPVTMPRVSIIKLDDRAHLRWPWLGANSDASIAAGDLVNFDVTLRYGGIAVAQQRTVYVPAAWESTPPGGVVAAFDELNQARAALVPLFRPGITGTDLVSQAEAWARSQHIDLVLDASAAGNVVPDAGTIVAHADYISPYDASGVLSGRPLQEGDLETLAFRLTVTLADGRALTLAAADTGVVGYGGLDLLAPAQTDLMH